MTTEEERRMKARNTERQIHGDTASLVKATKSNELASTHRVYVKQWLPVYKAEDEQVVREYFEKKFEGRVRDEDIDMGLDEELNLHYLKLRLWNVKAEWKDELLANAHLEELIVSDPDASVEVVARNSRKEHMLSSYGKLKLPQEKK